MKIKCTYEDCFQHFKDHASMLKHKDKEPAHDYCKKCDLDCQDDLALLIHQISSPKHIVCPICGVEFQSKSGRDSHVEVKHPQRQDLKCAGCDLKFTKASNVMSHIENDECKVIRLEHFERQRAEKQILKDAWESALDPTGGSVLHSDPVGSDNGASGGVSLLDDEDRPPVHQWDSSTRLGEPLKPLSNGQRSTGRMPSQINEAMAHLTIEQFPVLDTASKSHSQSTGNDQDPLSNDDDLVDFSKTEQRIYSKAQTQGIWSKSSNNSRALFPEHTNPSSQSSETQPGQSTNRSDLSAATYGTGNHSRALPQAGEAINEDPNAPHSRIQTTSQINPPSIINPYQYLHPIEQRFICPGHKCGRKFESPEDFSAHLLTGAHVGGHTQCPSCLRRFGTTTALISHCESGNKRCNIRKSANYNQVMRELTGGLIGTDGHLQDGTVRYIANNVGQW